MARNINWILYYDLLGYAPDEEPRDIDNNHVRKAKQQILTDLLEMAEDSWTREQLYQSTKPGVTVNSIKAVPVEAIKQYFGGRDE